MAAAANPVKNLEDEVTCSLCLEYFRDPILITKCAHSFCRDCITQHCKDQGPGVRCPHCRKTFHQENLISNRQLANMVEIVQCLKKTAQNRREESEVEKHQEVLKLFCENDQEAGKLWTQDFRDGLPPDGTAWENREREISEVSKQIEVVQDAISSTKQSSTEMNEYVSQIKGLITEDFGAMKRYLETQERATLQVIALEQRVAQQKIDEMIGQLTAKVNKLTNIKAQLGKGLQHNTMEQLSDTSTDSPIITQKITLDHRKICVVTSAVEDLKKQLETIILKNYPAQLPQGAVNVTFDPESIPSKLDITSENKKVIVSHFSTSYKPTAKRFRISQVMCSQSFSDGRHYWEVSTKDSSGWAVGVANGNIGRTDRLGRTELSWCVEWSDKNKQLSAWHNNRETRLSDQRPLTVGVFLDLENNHLSFYSLTDKEMLLHRFEISILHPVYPAFWLYGLDEEGSLTINHINRD
nr:E3 ubiquitin-protein ligase RNF135 isoform X2 [Pelodiscus sinensis]|eukprot:XP_014430129.1 E3 ubiquitin-protein ligase RNF135 isoform X2 [Pelodiscus sinensis]